MVEVEVEVVVEVVVVVEVEVEVVVEVEVGMTEQEAQSFIRDVLKGLWPDWEPTDAQYGLWVKKLRKFDYSKAKFAIGDWITESDFVGKRPPINKIFKSLTIKKAYIRRLGAPEAVKVFEIFCEDWQKTQYSVKPFKRKYSFWEASLEALKRRDPNEIEQDAEKKRQQYISWYGGSWVVVREWERYFERIPI